MKNFVPYEKMSKKQKKEFNQLKRNSWGQTNPVSRTVESKKKYTRKQKHKLAPEKETLW